VEGEVPFFAPVPEHDLQTLITGILILVSVPL
jgi:hypothetical protein